MDIEKVKAEVRKMFPSADASCTWAVFHRDGMVGCESANTEDEAWELAHRHCEDCKQAKFNVLERHPKATCVLVDDEYIVISKKRVIGSASTEPDAWYDANSNMSIALNQKSNSHHPDVPF